MADETINPRQVKFDTDHLAELVLQQEKAIAQLVKVVHGMARTDPIAAIIREMHRVGSGRTGLDPSFVETEFDVILTGFGDNKIGVIKVVRSATGMGLRETKDLVEAAPQLLKTRFSREEAEKLKREIEVAGGSAEIVGTSERQRPPQAQAAGGSELLGGVWTQEKNARRIELLKLRFKQQLSETQEQELTSLQEQCAEFLDQHAPFPP